MPYDGPNDPSLPAYVKKLSEKKRKQWIAVFESTLKSEGGSEEKAFKYANGVVKRSKKGYSEDGEFIPDRKLFAFELNYRPYGASDGKGCANCWFRQTADDCYLNYNPIDSTGICDSYRIPPGFDEPDEEGVLEYLKSLLEGVK